MKTTLLRLFTPPQPPDHRTLWTWILLEQQKAVPYRILAQGQSVLTDVPVAGVIELILPAHQVTFLRLRLPAGQRSRLLQALPYLVEEHLMSPPEQVHIALAMHDGDNATVATLEKSVLRGLLIHLAEQGVKPQRALPATLLLPLPDNGWSVAILDRDCFVRQEACYGFALEMPRDHLPPVSLRLALEAARNPSQNSHPPEQLWIFANTLPTAPNQIENNANTNTIEAPRWQEALGIPCHLNRNDSDAPQTGKETAMDWRSAPAPMQFNLLQGEFAPAHTDSALVRNSKKCGVLLLLLVLFHLAASSLMLLYKQHQIKSLQSDMTALFLNTFGQNNVVVDAALQMQRKFQNMQAAQGQPTQGDFLIMLAAASQHLSAELVKQVTAIQFQTGHLQLTIDQQSNETDLQQTISGLRKQGLLAKIQHDAKGQVILDIASQTENALEAEQQ